ncbi:beta-farnesene synthase-like, partial [Henckelia pumila]|uniref:beta-farnesene synthase-like n=1 Tax=Henckelia pumila TaxID=405737 RepID=UPI003C6E851C
MASEGFHSKNEIGQPAQSFPSMWGDTFISKNIDTHEVQVKYDESVAPLREEVREMLMAKESKTTMEKYDLFNTSLLFRLFRQHGYIIPCGVFDRFMKDTDDEFSSDLKSDIKGLLSLYEATGVRIQGENVLEEAITFTTYHLNRFRSEIDSNLLIREKVSRALHQSIHREVPIIGARYYIPIYEKEESSNELIVRFAKLNFNYLQSLYQKELFDLTRWWRDSNMCSKVPYVRDRIVESYVWEVGMNYEPQYSFARAAVAKIIQLTTVLDDTYDTYAPLEDLEIFTQVLQSGELGEIDRLPDYLKEIYKFIWKTYEEFDREASKHEKNYASSYFKESMKQLHLAYHKEANWYRRKHVPPFEDVLSLGLATS